MSESTDDKHDVELDAEYYVLMDEFGGDWTPFAVISDASEAIKLRNWLSEDAAAICTTGPYYESKTDVRDGIVSEPPTGLEEITVTFHGEEVFGVSDDDMAAREVQIVEDRGLRKTYPVYDRAETVAEENPSAIGEFIVSQMTADDIIDQIN